MQKREKCHWQRIWRKQEWCDYWVKQKMKNIKRRLTVSVTNAFHGTIGRDQQASHALMIFLFRKRHIFSLIHMSIHLQQLEKSRLPFFNHTHCYESPQYLTSYPAAHKTASKAAADPLFLFAQQLLLKCNTTQTPCANTKVAWWRSAASAQSNFFGGSSKPKDKVSAHIRSALGWKSHDFRSYTTSECRTLIFIFPADVAVGYFSALVRFYTGVSAAVFHS